MCSDLHGLFRLFDGNRLVDGDSLIFVCCNVGFGVEYGSKVTSWTGKYVAKCRDSKRNQLEQKKVDKDRDHRQWTRSAFFLLTHNSSCHCTHLPESN